MLEFACKVFKVFTSLRSKKFKTFDTLKSLCSCKLDFGGLMCFEICYLTQIETRSSPVYTIKHIQTFQSYSKVNTNATGWTLWIWKTLQCYGFYQLIITGTNMLILLYTTSKISKDTIATYKHLHSLSYTGKHLVSL